MSQNDLMNNEKPFVGNYRKHAIPLNANLTEHEVFVNSPIIYILTVPIITTCKIGDRSKDSFTLNRVKIIRAPKGQKIKAIYLTTVTTSTSDIEILTFDDDIFSDIGVSDTVTLVDSSGIEYDARNLRGYDGSDWQDLEVDASGNLKVAMFDNSNTPLNVIASGSDNHDNAFNQLVSASMGYIFNGATWDRVYSQVLQTLSDVTTTGIKTVFNLAVQTCHRFTVQAVRSAGTDEIILQIEGSINNVTFFDLSGSQTSASGELMFHVIDKPVKYLRINVTTIGTSTYDILTFVLP